MSKVDIPRRPRDLQVRVYQRMLAHALFRRMIARHGINLAGSWWRGFEEMMFGALDRCARCDVKPLCRTWLDHADSHHYPWFCPNTEIIEAYRIIESEALPLARQDGDAICGEPPITEVVGDPIVQQLMQADGVADPTGRRGKA